MKKQTIAIAGGTGFVGRALVERLRHRYNIIVLSRRNALSIYDNVEIRKCDLFSKRSIEESLEGADYAFYLIHSMSSNSRLTQAKFSDLDLNVADNFIKACSVDKIKQVIYLGGLIPKTTVLSKHLESRLEVEETLRSEKIPVTTFRCGLILGYGGSSYNVLKRLVRRLPIMVLPMWTSSYTQPISLPDVVNVLENAIGNDKLFNTINDIAGEEAMQYKTLLERTAQLMGRNVFTITAPFNSFTLSKLWVKTFSSTPMALISPLVESLKHDMIASNNYLEGKEVLSFDEAIRQANNQRTISPDFTVRHEQSSERRTVDNVRSIQRLAIPKGKSIEWVTLRYALWLKKTFRHIFDIRFSKSKKQLCISFLRIKLLTLTMAIDRSDSNRVLYRISGGLLVQKGSENKGRLEFRSILNGKYLLAGIHDFQPSLPWPIYVCTQAVTHLIVMGLFKNYLSKYREDKSPPMPGQLLRYHSHRLE